MDVDLDHSIFGDRHTGAHRSGPARPGQRRRRRGIRRALVLLVAVAVLAAGAWIAYDRFGVGIGGIDDYPGPGKDAVTIEIPAGATGAAIADTLRGADVVKSTHAYLRAASGNGGAAGIQPGFYAMKTQMKAADAVAYLVDPGNRILSKVTIPEGRRATEIYDLLSKATKRPVEDYLAAARNPDKLGLPAQAGGSLEGYLFPATYQFSPKDTAADQLKAMVGQMVTTTANLGIDPARMSEVLTVASLVEAEASRPEDRGKVARVIVNRLAAGMKLQLDSTVVYAIGRRGLLTTPQERAVKSPYNTYDVTGLPPGPICAPGEAALKAALGPTPGDWMYFVTVNPKTGETIFTTSFAEHETYVAQLQAFCRANGC